MSKTNSMAMTVNPSRNIVGQLDEVTSASGDADRHIRAEANNLIDREKESFASIGGLSERVFEANQNTRLHEKMLERGFVLTADSCSQTEWSTEQAHVV